MAADECRSAKCCVHQLKFATLPEFPDDTPDFSDVVGGFAMRRCQARVTAPDGGRMQVPMCAEDVSETGIEELFDDEGYLTAICPRHANMLIARAVEGRACTGARGLCAVELTMTRLVSKGLWLNRPVGGD